ncbi:MAG: septal ring lytic transglycosylase RlpA family protein [Candidatus Nitrospinota bacterium M3_3B_026]
MAYLREKVRPTAALAAVVIVAIASGCASRERIKKTHPLVSSAPERTAAPAPRLKSSRPYTINGVTYYPLADSYGFTQEGTASWYGKKFHGRKTSSGEVYDMNKVTAAHKTLPLGTVVEVRRLDTNGKIVVRINDRGPFVADRVIDLSREAARRLGMLEKGTAPVRVVALARGRPSPDGGPPVPEEPAPDFYHGRFYAQVGAFRVRENAERVRERLLFPLEKIRLEPVTTPEGLSLTRVQVGPFTDMDAAQAALSAAVEQGFDGSFIVAD